ncbi:MAG TPA: ABC transporter ATP-binding protein [Acidimicrobiales bacterium]|nr:ABC transporter ATP-binding protein [Acidimicrobiales bacterium]
MTGIVDQTGTDGGADPGPRPESQPPVLVCSELVKSFGERGAVDRLSFEVRAGEAYGLLGPNGAGKTTTLRMVCGILPSDHGTATIDGRAVSGRDGARARASLGYVPQGLALFPTLRLDENLRFWAKLAGVPRGQRRARVAEALALVGLEDRARDRVEQCSGGMQRRLNLAVALLHRPRLLVLDEPTVGVDPQSRASLLDRLAQLRDGGAAVLYTSHYMDEVARLCDRVGILDHGRLLEEGDPHELPARYGCEDLEAVFLQLTGRELRD